MPVGLAAREERRRSQFLGFAGVGASIRGRRFGAAQTLLEYYARVAETQYSAALDRWAAEMRQIQDLPAATPRYLEQGVQPRGARVRR
jgi:hypothetical protein